MGDSPTACLWLANKVYVRVVHRLKVRGKKMVPNAVQSQCRFKIRWLMAEEFMKPALHFVWKHSQVIPVARDGQDATGLRVALRHLKKNGVIGIFPEGGIKQPREAIHPFADGVGAMISHTRAKVLLVTVEGTPKNDEMDGAIFERSHSVVRFLDIIEYPESATKSEITSDLRVRLSKATGWSLVN